MAVLLKIATVDDSNHTFIGIGILADGTRFEEEQDSSGGVPVGVVLATDLMNNVVAEGHVSKSSGRAGRSKFPLILFRQKPLNSLGDDEVVGIGLPVYQIRPIEIAPRGPFASCERAEYNQTRVLGRVPPISFESSLSNSSRLRAASRDARCRFELRIATPAIAGHSSNVA